MISQRFCRLLVIEDKGKNIKGQYVWNCLCDCGNHIVLSTATLRSGNTKSCGCLHKQQLAERNKGNKKWNAQHPRLKRIWNAMKHRCENEKNNAYKHYGGKGICVCDEWQDFYSFEKWSLQSGYNNELTIDRIDENEGYFPLNCRWVSMTIQNNHKSNNKYLEYKGETKTLAEWCRELNLDYFRTKARLNTCKWTIEQAFTRDKYKTPHKKEDN